MDSLLTTEASAPTARDESPPRSAPFPGGAFADWQLVAVLVVVAVLLPALVLSATGAWSVPANDDWSYRFSALRFARTGDLIFTGWGAITLIGQLLWSWPFLKVFGTAGWFAIRLSTALLGVVGVSCAYYLARQLLSRKWAFLAVVLVVALPGFAWSTSTYMSDVPAFAAEMACLALGLVALRREGRPRWWILSASMAVGVFGFAIREFALFAPVAVLICAAIQDIAARRRRYLVAGMILLLACGGIYFWSSEVPHASHVTITLPSISRIGALVESYFTLALALSPAIAVAAWRRLRVEVPWGVLAAAAVIVLGAVVLDRNYHQLFVGNYLDPDGITGSELIAGGRATLVPWPLWSFLTLLALLSGALLAWIAVESAFAGRWRWRTWDWGTPLGVLRMTVVLLGIGLPVYGAFAFPFFDRYLWPLALPLALVLLHEDGERRRSRSPAPVSAAAVAISALLVVIAAALTVNVDSYDAARWHAGEVAVAHGVPPTYVDAGLEWVGTHAGIGIFVHVPKEVPPYQPWYAQMRRNFRECGVVSGTLIADPQLHLVAQRRYQLLGFAARRSLYIYVSSAPGCLAASAGRYGSS